MRTIKTLVAGSLFALFVGVQAANAAVPTGGVGGCRLVQRTTEGLVCLD
jgi:hypothetical protein